LRYYATSSGEDPTRPVNAANNLSGGTADGERVGAVKRGWRYAVQVVRSFVQGMKLLIADGKNVRQLKKKMKGLKIDGQKPHDDVTSITWKELRFVHKTTADIKRTLPTIVLFWIPFLGYVAPFLALSFPGQLLSSHFWSDKQKIEFGEKIKEQRQIGIKALKGHVLIDKGNINKIITGCLSKIEEETSEISCEWINESPILDMSLNQLSRNHLMLLSQSWGVKSRITISWWIRRKLTRHLNYIYTGDHLFAMTGNNHSNMNKVWYCTLHTRA
jgi:hypothetical protein